MLKLSIIIPCYNCKGFIEKTYKSILEQTKHPYEVIFINDGSKDNTLEILKKIKEENKSNMIIRIIDKKNKGVSVARNIGMETAVGNYICFLDSDDFYESDFVEEIEKKIIKKNFDLIYFPYNECDINGKKKRYSYNLYEKLSGEKLLEKYLKEKTHLWTGSVIYNRQFLIENKIKYTPFCKFGEDVEFIIKAIYYSKKVETIGKPLVNYLVHSMSTMKSKVSVSRIDSLYAIRRVEQLIDEKKIKKLLRYTKESNELMFISRQFRKGFTDYPDEVLKNECIYILFKGIFYGENYKRKILKIIELLYLLKVRMLKNEKN